MAVQHQRFVDLMERLVRKGGRAVTVRHAAGSVPVDVLKPWLGTVSAPVDEPAFAAFLDDDARDFLLLLPGRPDERTAFERQIDRAVYLPAKGLTLDVKIADRIVDGTTEWEVTKLIRIEPGATLIGYVLDVSV